MGPWVTRVAVAVGCIVVLAIVVVTSDQRPSSPAITAAAPAGPELPPDDLALLSAEFDPVFAPMGLRLTRGGLQPVPGAEYEAFEEGGEGKHLALYVEPLDESYSASDYLSSLVTATAAILPEVFEEWKGLESMDICQEPPPGSDDSVAPPPVTTVAVTRQQAGAIAWDDLDLVSLLVAMDEGRLMALHVDEPLRQSGGFAEARAAADRARAQQVPR